MREIVTSIKYDGMLDAAEIFIGRGEAGLNFMPLEVVTDAAIFY